MSLIIWAANAAITLYLIAFAVGIALAVLLSPLLLFSGRSSHAPPASPIDTETRLAMVRANRPRTLLWWLR